MRFFSHSRRSGKLVFAALPVFLAALTIWAAPIELTRQVITLPAAAGKPLFIDADGDGLSDMLVIDPVQKQLLNYRQRAGGFSNTPDQAIPMPPQTGWVSLCDVEAEPGLELLMSTATGVYYSQQTGGVFESERRLLIQANQVFTNADFPFLITLNTNKSGTNDVISVISAAQAVIYHRDGGYDWSPLPPMALSAKRTVWSVPQNHWRDSWTLGANRAHSLGVEQSVQAGVEQGKDKESENEFIRKLVAELKKDDRIRETRTDQVDVDGDGRGDLVLWQFGGFVDFKTDIYIFLRGADQQLPERPTQILHCRGVPLPMGGDHVWSPMHDLKGDGVCELVLVDFKIGLVNASGAVKMALSHGVDWAVTIRSFHNGAFARSPEASIPVTTLLPAEALNEWGFSLQGDFNGDGRPDLLIRRSDTQWNIFLSTTDGRWFSSQPGITFTTPVRGALEVVDLNHDGLSDIIWHEVEDSRLSIYMSPPLQTRSKNP